MDLILFISILILIAASAFFSGSETSLMSLNRYKLRHLAKQHNKAAQRSHEMLKRPDRLLGVILIGNTFANVMASALVTLLAVSLFGNVGVVFTTIILTFIILIFAEVMPKTVAAYFPEKIALPASLVLKGLLTILYPLVWLINTITNSILSLFGLKMGAKKIDSLSLEELRSVVYESKSHLSEHYRNMLLGVMDIDQATVEDCLVRKRDLYAIDLNQDWQSIYAQLTMSAFSKLPVYRGNIDKIIGVLPLKKAMKLLNMPNARHAELEKLIDPPYFIPEMTSLRQQLIHFQKTGEKFGIVVNEYGEVTGLVTVEDIIEEIVGEFTSLEHTAVNDLTQRQADGSYIVDGAMTIRDVNRDLNMDLPTDGPKTLSGLITEHLESIPVSNTSVLINQYPIDIVTVQGKAVKQTVIYPKLTDAVS